MSAAVAAGVIAVVFFLSWLRHLREGMGELGMTIALVVPTMIDVLLEDGSLGASNPRILQYSAAPIHPDTLRGALAALPHIRMQREISAASIRTATSVYGVG